ncbi:DUF292-domain-containing protein [Epithele typhae]|uniref:DUF292-domain-containing protein n=1 Tax=Epithele typhae TaxID=378194 RepID=UPI002007A378|nr:DUF292-domain-containing protein [Epithele typhae]KAH9920202.1 DUF292-domain-containing protein [Epithele typhae]
MAPWNAAKAKAQSQRRIVRLGVQRLRTLQEKKLAQAKASRRDIALLLEKGRLETARIKTENIINEDIYVELLELLELYCELLIARFGLLDQSTREPDPGVSEGVCAIIFAAPRTELKELHVLRDILMHKFGRDFALAVIENRDGCVSDRVARKLDIATPSTALVDAYLSEIAKGTASTGPRPGPTEPAVATEKEKEDAQKPPSADAIAAEARSAGARTPKLPEVPVDDDGNGKEKERAEAQQKAAAAAAKFAPPPDPPKNKEEEDEFDALTKRFEALKKR